MVIGSVPTAIVFIFKISVHITHSVILHEAETPPVLRTLYRNIDVNDQSKSIEEAPHTLRCPVLSEVFEEKAGGDLFQL